MKRKAVKRSVATLVGACVLYVAWTAWAIWTFPAAGSTRADAALVLGAAESNGEPSPVFAERINHGMALYKQGLVKKLIVTGGTPDGESISLAEAASRYALGQPQTPFVLAMARMS